MSVALDSSLEEARPYVERAKPEHPSLIDTEHVVADLYGMINVPTGVWIDEEGRIARPCHAAFGSDLFKQFTGIESKPYLDALRRWVRDGALPAEAAAPRDQLMLPTSEEQLARAEFTLAWYLHRAGRREAAERHFLRAGELSPNDWTIRRGSMPIRGIDPMGPRFFELYEEWKAAGSPRYTPRRGAGARRGES
jgi:hypothetical protein